MSVDFLLRYLLASRLYSKEEIAAALAQIAANKAQPADAPAACAPKPDGAA